MMGPNSSGRSGCQQHDCPSGLAVADDGRLTLSLGMQRDDALEECRFGVRDVLDCLPRHRLREEADEIAGMPCPEGNADLAVRLEAADAGAMAGARVDNHERTLARVDLYTIRRNDPDEHVVDRAAAALRPSMMSE